MNNLDSIYLDRIETLRTQQNKLEISERKTNRFDPNGRIYSLFDTSKDSGIAKLFFNCLNQLLICFHEGKNAPPVSFGKKLYQQNIIDEIVQMIEKSNQLFKNEISRQFYKHNQPSATYEKFYGNLCNLEKIFPKELQLAHFHLVKEEIRRTIDALKQNPHPISKDELDATVESIAVKEVKNTTEFQAFVRRNSVPLLSLPFVPPQETAESPQIEEIREFANQLNRIEQEMDIPRNLEQERRASIILAEWLQKIHQGLLESLRSANKLGVLSTPEFNKTLARTGILYRTLTLRMKRLAAA